jgi:hypothetical protein
MGKDMPHEWNSAYICPTYKKGDMKGHNNHRGISITNSIGRILSRVIKNKIANMITASEMPGILSDNKLCVKKKVFFEALEKAYNKEIAVDWD